MRKSDSEKKSKRKPNQISIERREFLKTTGVATAGVATGVVPPSPAIAQKRREAALGAKGVDYIDIRDYGPVEDGGDITAPVQAALRANVDNPRTVRIPWVGTGVYFLDPITWPGGWNNTDHSWILEFNCHQINLTGTFNVPGSTTIRGLATEPGGAILQQPMPMPLFAPWGPPIDPMFYISQPSCKLEGLRVQGGGTAVKMYATSCCTLERCCLGSDVVGSPALVVDHVFWLEMRDCLVGPSGGLGDTTTHAIAFTTSDASVLTNCGLVRARNILIYGRGILIKPTYGPAGCNNMRFEDLVSEGAPNLSALVEIDSTNKMVYDIWVTRPATADPGNWGDAVAYILKNTGRATYDIGLAGEPAYDYLHPDSDTIHGFHLEYDSNVPQGKIYPSYTEWYGRDYGTAVDAKLVCAPRAPQQVIGTVLDVIQNAADWIPSGGATVTPGQLAPDGSYNAGLIQGPGGAFACNLSLPGISLGDWFIAGVWLQAYDFQNFPAAVGGVGALMFTHPPEYCCNDAVPDEIPNPDMCEEAQCWVQDGAWVWVCMGLKITNVGTGNMTLRFQLGHRAACRAFNPCIQYIPVALGMRDADVVVASRSYRGGWSSKAAQGDVGVLDHQKFRIAGGVRIFSSHASPADLLPAQAHTVGDICWNSAPAVGQPKGWMCTVAGSPGTWVSMGNL